MRDGLNTDLDVEVDGREDISASPQSAPLERRPNEVGGRLTRTNPFYQHYLASSSSGHAKEDDKGRTSDAALDAIFGPPPELQKSHLDLNGGIKTVQREAEPSQDPLQTLLSAGQASANGIFPKETQSDPEPQSMNFSSILQHQNSRALKNEGFRAFPAAEVENLFPAAFPGEGTCLEKRNLFDTPPSDTDLSTPAPNKEPQHSSRSAVTNAVQRAPVKAADLFSSESPMKDDLFARSEVKDVFASPANTGNPFSSPAASDLFQDFTNVDPFDSPLSKQDDDFKRFSSGAPDIFQPLSSKAESRDLFETPRSSASSTLPYATPSWFKVSPDSTMDNTWSSPGFLEEHLSLAPAASQSSSAERPDVVLTTPQGTKKSILQPTPFTRARNLRLSSSQSPVMTHVSTVKRPPKPLPRTRAPPPPPKEKPPVPERPPKPAAPVAALTEAEGAEPKTPSRPAFGPLAKPVIPLKPKTSDNKPVDREDFVVFRDILLIGQEKCVEDWPEDSPELSPHFKPSGTLRLRRESLKAKADSDGGSGEDQDGSGTKKKDSKFKMSLPSRRGSKERFSDDAKEGKSKTLPSSRKSSKEYSSDLQMSAEENGEELSAHKKKPLKHRVSHLLRKASSASVSDGKHVNGNSHRESKDGNAGKGGATKKESFQRWPEGTALDDSSAEEQVDEEEDEGLEAKHEKKKKKKVKIKFVPQRGFTISLEKPDDLKGAHGYTPSKGCKDDVFEDGEELQQPYGMAAFQNGEHSQGAVQPFTGLNENEFSTRMEDCKPKKPRHKGDFPSTSYSDSAGGQRDSVAFSHHIPQQASSVFAEDYSANLPRSPGRPYDTEQDELGICKQKKPSKFKGLKKLRAKKKTMHLRSEDPPGAASSDYLSDAARAEWLAAQRDEQGIADLEDEEEYGDTDSLMEWWYTVEKWDELPSDDEDKTLKEDESKSFTILADKVQRGLRLFNKVFTERAEVLWQSIIQLHSIAENISTVHQKAKIAGITGGTTTAVGGVAAIAGLALAPFTFGTSLVITAVGVGVATAGGITSASAAISDNINNMHDRKKVETILEEYEDHLLDIGKILHFVNQGLYKLRGHPFLRSGTQHYSQDWEIRKAVQMIGMVDTPVMRAVDVTDSAVASVQGLFKGMDKYFVKDSRELKKGCKKEIVAEIKEVANILNDAIVTLNAAREELQEATGDV